MPPAWVQDNTDSLADSDTASTIAATFGAAVAAGSLIFTWAGWGTGDVTPTCSDSVNGAHTAYGKIWDAVNGQGHCAFYRANTGAGATTVTVSFGVSKQYKRMQIAEYSGVTTSSPQDGNTLRVQSGTTTPSSGNITTTVNGDLVFANIQNIDEGGSGSGTVTAGTGYTEREQRGVWTGSMEDQVQASAGSIDGTWTLDAAKRCICHIMAMKAAPPPPSNEIPPRQALRPRAFAPGLAR